MPDARRSARQNGEMITLAPAAATALALAGVGCHPAERLGVAVEHAPTGPLTMGVLGPYIDEQPGRVCVGLALSDGDAGVYRLELATFKKWNPTAAKVAQYGEELAELETAVVLKAPKSLVASGGQPTGVVIVALPADGGEITYNDGDTAPIHQTLVYLGSVDELSTGERDAVRNVAGVLAAEVEPFDATAIGRATLGADGDEVVLTEADELQLLHDLALGNPVVAEMYEARNGHPSWISHITGSDAATGDTIRFDRIGVWFGPSKTELPLRGTAPQDPGPGPGHATHDDSPASADSGVFDKGAFEPSFLGGRPALTLAMWKDTQPRSELGNAWRDELGRFAEKGYRLMSGTSSLMSVTTADGSTVSLSDSGNLLSGDMAAETANAVADVYDRVDMAAVPEILVHDSEAFVDMGFPASTFIAIDDGNILINGDRNNEMDDLAASGIDNTMAVSNDLTVARYQAIFAMSQLHLESAGLRDKLRLVFAAEISALAIPEAANGSSRATYGHLFTEYVGSRGTTSSEPAQVWAKKFGWDSHIVDNTVPTETSAPIIGEDTAIAAAAGSGGAHAVAMLPDGGVMVTVDGVDVGDDIMNDDEAFTIDGSVVFGNPWRDDIGRFAPKGYDATGTGDYLMKTDRDAPVESPQGGTVESFKDGAATYTDGYTFDGTTWYNPAGDATPDEPGVLGSDVTVDEEEEDTDPDDPARTIAAQAGGELEPTEEGIDEFLTFWADMSEAEQQDFVATFGLGLDGDGNQQHRAGAPMVEEDETPLKSPTGVAGFDAVGGGLHVYDDGWAFDGYGWRNPDGFQTDHETGPIFDNGGGVQPAQTAEASFTIDGSVVFGNDWRDELGRYARKGYTFTPSQEHAYNELRESGVSEAEAREQIGPTAEIITPDRLTRNEKGEVVASPEAKVLGTVKYQRAVELEPEISAMVAGMVGDVDPNTYQESAVREIGEMFGFEFRIKKEVGIQTKIDREIADGNFNTREQAAESFDDSVRYTAHFDEANYAKSAQDTIDQLRAHEGIVGVQVKNRFAAPKAGNDYRGTHAIVTQGDGFQYEVQFHTPRTQKVKDQMHSIYERARVLPDDAPERADLYAQISQIAAPVITDPPPGVFDVLAVHGSRIIGFVEEINPSPSEKPNYDYWKMVAPGSTGQVVRTAPYSFGVEAWANGEWVRSNISYEDVMLSPNWAETTAPTV
jgi:hypothetical protein